MEKIVLARGGGDARGRAAIVARHLETAMSAIAAVDRASLDDLTARDRGCPGQRRIRLPQTLVAIDGAAHLGLASYEKRTVFTQPFAHDAPGIDIERLIWSSVNTSHAFALCASAWTSSQSLPFGALARFDMPPLRIDALRAKGDPVAVRVIRHGREEATGVDALLRGAGFSVVCDDDGWSDEAAIHIHIGAHDIHDDRPRLVDSWASGRIVVQCIGRKGDRPGATGLSVGHEYNGLYCPTVNDIVVACEELRGDPEFRAKLVKAGHQTAAPLQRGWKSVADALLA